MNDSLSGVTVIYTTHNHLLYLLSGIHYCYGLLLSGSFVHVSLKIRTAPTVEIPAEALLMKGEHAYVASIALENKVKFLPVVVADSDGKVVRLSSGLGDGELVILNPSLEISDNEQIQPILAVEK